MENIYLTKKTEYNKNTVKKESFQDKTLGHVECKG